MRLGELLKWMDEQLMVDSIDTVDQFGSQLESISLDRLSRSELIAVSEAAAAFTVKLRGRLAAGFRHEALPLQGKALRKRQALERLCRSVLEIEHARIVDIESDDSAEPGAAATSYLRCIEWVSGVIRDRYAAYDEVPRDWLLELHGTFARAQQHLEGVWNERAMQVHAAYVALLLFAMINPYALNRKEMDEMHDCLKRIAHHVKISGTPPSDHARFVDVTGRVMPHVTLSPRAASTTTGMFLDVEPLMDAEVLSTISEACRESVARFVGRLRFHLVQRAPREAKKEIVGTVPVNMVLGFLDVHYFLERELNARADDDRHKLDMQALSLSGDSESGQQRLDPADEDIGGLGHFWRRNAPKGRKAFSMDIRVEDDGAWQSEGIVTGREDVFQGDEQAVARHLDKNRTDGWQLINISRGGYRLRWRFEQDCHAAVDALVYIQPSEDAENTDLHSGLGIIRWVRHVSDSGLDIGIQRISGAFEAHYARQRNGRSSGFGDRALPILVGLDENKSITRVVLQADSYRPGETILISGIEKTVTLGHTRMAGEGFVVMDLKTDGKEDADGDR